MITRSSGPPPQISDPPSYLLGLHYERWTKLRIQQMLDHYDWRYNACTRTCSKKVLYHELYLLVQATRVTETDRKEIFKFCDSHDRNSQRVYSRARQRAAGKQAQSGTASQPVSATSVADVGEDSNDGLNNASSPLADCVVCFETLNVQNTLNRNITSSCNHERNICSSCLSISIATQIDSKVWDQIDCPICSQRLDFHDVKEFADPAVFRRYDNHSVETCLSGGGQFQRCRQPGCQFGQQCFPEEDNYMICAECRGATCITCDIIWHPSETCAQIASRRAEQGAEEAAATQYLTTNVKLCPRCNVRGEKISGCDHITCPRCRFQYCWVCLADYTEILRHGNTRHRSDCRYHSNNLLGNLPAPLPVNPLAHLLVIRPALLPATRAHRPRRSDFQVPPPATQPAPPAPSPATPPAPLVPPPATRPATRVPEISTVLEQAFSALYNRRLH